MLRSLHYYACYYFLLCLLHQQQQAASLTIIIDGATTNEWATRDEYQRLVEATSGNGQQQQQQRGQPTGGLELASGNRQPDEEDEQQLEADGKGASISAAEELELSLDRLDLIEAQQMKLKQLERQQQQLQLQPQLQRHSPNIINQHYHPQQERQRSFAGGARTLNDLVPVGDELDPSDEMDPRQRLVERESTPQKYCGSKLMDVLELVCQGRFYGGDYEPQIMNPTIKSKRFIESLAAENGNVEHSNVRQAASLMGDNDGNQRAAIPEHQQLEPVSRRRKLRTLASEYDGDNIRLTEANKNKIINNNKNTDSNNNHYLSYSKNNDQIIKQQQQQLTNPINNNDNYQQQTNLNSNNRQNKHSKMYLYRRIRGASAECCERACYIEELKPYCKT